MTRSSPTRRSQVFTSPERGFLTSFLAEPRNTEYSHRDALAAAQLEHERVREAAVRVYKLHELQEEHNRIIEQERIERERLEKEAAVAREELKLRELKAKSIPKPPPEPEPPRAPEPPKQTEPPKVQEPSKSHDSAVKPPEPIHTQSSTAAPLPPRPSPFTAQPGTQPSPALFGNAVSKKEEPKKEEPKKTLGALTNGSTAAQPKAVTPQPLSVPKPAPTATSPATNQTAQRYAQIHQELKKLRKNLVAESKVPGSPMKGQLGSFRREIRVSIGQLTSGKGANAKPIAKITEILKDALQGKVPSSPIDVSVFVTDNRQPADGAPNNDPTLPSLFIYLLNICAKGIINQFINEGGANPKAADPVGIFAAHIFSHKDLQWRGQPLVDILIAKFRVVCPVLFGLRGNDRMERGRLALGWKKEGPSWIPEQTHNDRMTGLGAGFASLSLRDFSKSSKVNPYPPTNYWKALAGIINTPAGETSNTQYVVLRAMIEGHEQRFLNFYGNAALAALRLALIEFPKKAPENAAASGSLRALAEVLRSDGLILS